MPVLITAHPSFIRELKTSFVLCVPVRKTYGFARTEARRSQKQYDVKQLKMSCWRPAERQIAPLMASCRAERPSDASN